MPVLVELLDLSKVLKPPRKAKTARPSTSKDAATVVKRASVVKSSTPTNKTIAYKMAETLAALLVEYELLHRDDAGTILKSFLTYTSKLYPEPVEDVPVLPSIEEASERTLSSDRRISKTNHVEESPLVASASVPLGMPASVSAPDSTCCEAVDEDEVPLGRHVKDSDDKADKGSPRAASSLARLPSGQSITTSQAGLSRHSSARSTAPTEDDPMLSGLTSPTGGVLSPPPGQSQSQPTTPIRLSRPGPQESSI